MNKNILGFWVIVLLFTVSGLKAQQSTIENLPQNSVDLSIGGVGMGFTFNYGRVVAKKPGYLVIASLGAGSVPSVGGLSIPHRVSFNFGKKNSFLEAGIGGAYWSGREDSAEAPRIHSYQLAPIIGWRKYFKNHWLFRLHATPLFTVSGTNFLNNKDIVFYGGISLGYAF